jgi:hypothetical protein
VSLQENRAAFFQAKQKKPLIQIDSEQPGLQIREADDGQLRLDLTCDEFGGAAFLYSWEEEKYISLLCDYDVRDIGMRINGGEIRVGTGDHLADVCIMDSTGARVGLSEDAELVERAKQRVWKSVRAFPRGTETRIWWVNQGLSWKFERKKSLVCSSALTTQLKYRAFVADIRKGDVIVHYAKPDGIVALSRAKQDARWCDWVPPNGDVWYGPGWRVKTEYHDLSPISRDVVAKKLARIKQTDNPVIPSGTVRQAYCMPFSAEGLSVLRAASTQKWPRWATSVIGR